MNYIYGFSGNLRQDSKALFGILEKKLKITDFTLIESSYLIACQNAGLEESCDLRTAGTSFNPKPARIAQILIEYLEINSLETICAALIVNSESAPSLNPKINLILEEIRTSQKQELSQNAEAVLLAKALDDLRHFHLSSDRSWKFEKIHLTEEILNNNLNHFKRHKIADMLKLAFDRAYKNMNKC